MIQEKEQNKEMTAQESLGLINEMLNNSRRSILQNSAKYYILWGALLVAFSVTIWWLWHSTGNPRWNWLWFAMPAVGYPLAALLSKRNVAVPENTLSRHLGWIWIAYGVFAVSLALVAMLLVPMPLTLTIVVVLGFAEYLCGILLRNWPVIVAGFLFGVGGAVAAMMLKSDAQLLLFTLGGLILVVTGLILKYQYK